MSIVPGPALLGWDTGCILPLQHVTGRQESCPAGHLWTHGRVALSLCALCGNTDAPSARQTCSPIQHVLGGWAGPAQHLQAP